MKYLLLITTFLIFITFSPQAQTYSLPEPSPTPVSEAVVLQKVLTENLPKVTILPDSPLYKIKTTLEQIRLVLTSSSEERAQLLINFALSRLAESFALQQREKLELAQKALADFSNLANQAETMLENSNNPTASLQSTLTAHWEKYNLLQTLQGEYTIQWRR